MLHVFLEVGHYVLLTGIEAVSYTHLVTSYELLQTGWEQDEIQYAKRPILEAAYVLGLSLIHISLPWPHSISVPSDPR